MSDPQQLNPANVDATTGGDGRAAAHLFTLRLWHADTGDGRREWRGRLHHVGHDDVTYFRGWAALLPVLLAMLRRAGARMDVEQEPPPDESRTAQAAPD